MPTSALPINENLNYTALKTELQTNPTSLSDKNGVTLTTLIQEGKFEDCANLLNAPTATTIPTGILPVSLFQSKIVGAELMALSPSQRADLSNFLSEFQTLFGGIPLNDPGTWNNVIPAFFTSNAPVYTGYTENTYQELAKLKSRNASRAELILYPGVVITWQDIAQAWNWT